MAFNADTSSIQSTLSFGSTSGGVIDDLPALAPKATKAAEDKDGGSLTSKAKPPPQLLPGTKLAQVLDPASLTVETGLAITVAAVLGTAFVMWWANENESTIKWAGDQIGGILNGAADALKKVGVEFVAPTAKALQDQIRSLFVSVKSGLESAGQNIWNAPGRIKELLQQGAEAIIRSVTRAPALPPTRPPTPTQRTHTTDGSPPIQRSDTVAPSAQTQASQQADTALQRQASIDQAAGDTLTQANPSLQMINSGVKSYYVQAAGGQAARSLHALNPSLASVQQGKQALDKAIAASNDLVAASSPAVRSTLNAWRTTLIKARNAIDDWLPAAGAFAAGLSGLGGKHVRFPALPAPPVVISTPANGGLSADRTSAEISKAFSAASANLARSATQPASSKTLPTPITKANLPLSSSSLPSSAVPSADPLASSAIPTVGSKVAPLSLNSLPRTFSIAADGSLGAAGALEPGGVKARQVDAPPADAQLLAKVWLNPASNKAAGAQQVPPKALPVQSSESGGAAEGETVPASLTKNPNGSITISEPTSTPTPNGQKDPKDKWGGVKKLGSLVGAAGLAEFIYQGRQNDHAAKESQRVGTLVPDFNGANKKADDLLALLNPSSTKEQKEFVRNEIWRGYFEAANEKLDGAKWNKFMNVFTGPEGEKMFRPEDMKSLRDEQSRFFDRLKNRPIDLAPAPPTSPELAGDANKMNHVNNALKLVNDEAQAKVALIGPKTAGHQSDAPPLAKPFDVKGYVASHKAEFSASPERAHRDAIAEIWKHHLQPVMASLGKVRADAATEANFRTVATDWLQNSAKLDPAILTSLPNSEYVRSRLAECVSAAVLDIEKLDAALPSAKASDLNTLLAGATASGRPTPPTPKVPVVTPAAAKAPTLLDDKVALERISALISSARLVGPPSTASLESIDFKPEMFFALGERHTEKSISRALEKGRALFLQIRDVSLKSSESTHLKIERLQTRFNVNGLTPLLSMPPEPVPDNAAQPTSSPTLAPAGSVQSTEPTATAP